MILIIHVKFLLVVSWRIAQSFVLVNNKKTGVENADKTRQQMFEDIKKFISIHDTFLVKTPKHSKHVLRIIQQMLFVNASN